jgi:hypothetical protein
MRPVNVFTPEMLRIAPTSAELTVTPSPETLSGSAELISPEIASVASLATVVVPAVVPRAFACEIATTPAETVVEPLYELLAESVNVLALEVFLVMVPVPEMAPDNVWLAEDA